MSKVVLRLSFKHPNMKSSANKNVAHMNYIATRPGADKTLTEQDLEKEIEKGISEIETSEEIESENDLYAKYIDERPNSHGLFSEDGAEDLKVIQEEIRNHSSFVWRGIISLKEEDASELGFLNKSKWQDTLCNKVPDIAYKMGISPTNLKWVGAVHMEKGHPHAHIMFWEKEPKMINGIISKNTLNEMRKELVDDIFEEQRLNLLLEKNTMRDLIQELAKGDVSKANKIKKELSDGNIYSKEIEAININPNIDKITPRLYPEQEEKLAEMIKELSKKMPGSGRAALKFMAPEIKEDVRNIADYILKQPAFEKSLEKNLKATEELTKMYTTNKEDINKARENAYGDIRDRIAQIILKGTVTFDKLDKFTLKEELSVAARNYLIDNAGRLKIETEHIKVMEEISRKLKSEGFDNQKIKERLIDFKDDNNLSLSDDRIKFFLDDPENKEDLSDRLYYKRIEQVINNAKFMGLEKDEAYNHATGFVKTQVIELRNNVEKLKEKGYFELNKDKIVMSDAGREELLKSKELTSLEKSIFKKLENKEEKVSFEELVGEDEIFSKLHDTDPQIFTMGKFDLKIRGLFGDENKLAYEDLENLIYEKHKDENLKVDINKAEQEIEILKKRIEKLMTYGYVSFDNDKKVYSFLEKYNNYFEKEKESEGYNFTPYAVDKLSIAKGIEFTNFDATVTMGYIDNAESDELTDAKLKEIVFKETINSKAEETFRDYNSILKDETTYKYINIGEDSKIMVSKEGEILGRNINQLNKYIKTEISAERLNELTASDEKLKITIENSLKSKILIQSEDGNVSINPYYKSLNGLLYQVYKEGGSIDKKDLKSVLEKNIPNYQANRQYESIKNRLEEFKKQGYIEGDKDIYKISQKGEEKRKDLLVPQRVYLKDKLDHLKDLQLIKGNSKTGFETTPKYENYMKNVALSKELKIDRESEIPKYLEKIIERTNGNIDFQKIENNLLANVRKNEFKTDYEKIDTSYGEARSSLKIDDLETKTVSNMATTMLVSGIESSKVKEFLEGWSQSTDSNIDKDKINEIVEKSKEAINENALWEKTTVIMPKDFKEMFRTLGVEEDNIPKWMYSGKDWTEFDRQSFQSRLGLSIVNNVWKSAFSEIERQNMQTTAQAYMLRKQADKQMGISKQAMKEIFRKNKAGTLHKEDELER